MNNPSGVSPPGPFRIFFTIPPKKIVRSKWCRIRFYYRPFSCNFSVFMNNKKNLSWTIYPPTHPRIDIYIDPNTLLSPNLMTIISSTFKKYCKSPQSIWNYPIANPLKLYEITPLQILSNYMKKPHCKSPQTIWNNPIANPLHLYEITPFHAGWSVYHSLFKSAELSLCWWHTNFKWLPRAQFSSSRPDIFRHGSQHHNDYE